jgi:selenocysteine lyase/cysteine desulfurase
MAHAAGAEVFLDAVHSRPTGHWTFKISTATHLVCSGYKILGLTHGFVWGKRQAMKLSPHFARISFKTRCR